MKLSVKNTSEASNDFGPVMNAGVLLKFDNNHFRHSVCDPPK